MPRLTIAIPTVNRAYLLERAIESALAQTSTDIEIIVSDNGSTDETPAVIARYAGRGLRTFRRETTISSTKHGQFIMEQVKGEFLVPLSDDDYLEPDFAAEVLAAFDRNPEAAFVYTRAAIHYEDIEVPGLVGPPLESGMDFLAGHYGDGREICWCACVTRVRELRELTLQMPDDWVIGDMFVWTKLAFRGPVACVNRTLAHYILFRPRNDNVSHGTSPMRWAQESRQMAGEILATAKERGASAEYLSNFEMQSRNHVARSVANQFIWTRIRGASRMDAMSWAMECLPYLSWTWPAISRLGAALILPRRVLHKALMKGAAKQAASRNEAASSRKN